MGLGSTAKKIQMVAETAEKLYEQIMELRERIVHLEESVDETTDRVSDLEVRTEEQTAILRAMAEEQGIDVDQVLADAAIEEAEGEDASDESEEATSRADGDADGAEEDFDEPTVVDSSGEPVE